MDNQTRPICDYEGSSYRTDFWEGREYEDGAERLALRRLLPPTGERLVDVGAGFGRLADLYAGYRQVVLVDYSRSQLQYARSRLGDERFLYVAADIYRLPLATAAADVVVMVRVLHHLVDVPAALAQLARITRGQGALLLEQANKRHLKNRLRHLVHRGPDPHDQSPHEFAPLHFDFHPHWVRDRLLAAGYQPEVVRSLSLLRLPLLKRLVPTRLLVGFDGLLQRPTAAAALGPSLLWRARRSDGPTALAPADALFRCPACQHEPLATTTRGLACPACGAAFPLHEGVYDFKGVDVPSS